MPPSKTGEEALEEVIGLGSIRSRSLFPPRYELTVTQAVVVKSLDMQQLSDSKKLHILILGKDIQITIGNSELDHLASFMSVLYLASTSSQILVRMASVTHRGALVRMALIQPDLVGLRPLVKAVT